MLIIFVRGLQNWGVTPNLSDAYSMPVYRRGSNQLPMRFQWRQGADRRHTKGYKSRCRGKKPRQRAICSVEWII
jgi:hypothetical protein